MSVPRRYAPIDRIGQGTTQTKEYQLRRPSDENPDDWEPVDLTDASQVTLTLQHNSQAFSAAFEDPCTITIGDEGRVEYQWTEDVTWSAAGDYYAQFEVAYNDGTSELVPPDGYDWWLRIARRQSADPLPFHTSNLEADVGWIGDAEIDSATIHELVDGVASTGPISNLAGSNLYIQDGALNAFDPGGSGEVFDHSHTSTAGEGGPIGTASTPAAPANFAEAAVHTAPVNDVDVARWAEVGPLESSVSTNTTNIDTNTGDISTLQTTKADRDGDDLTPETVAPATKPWADVTNYGATGDGTTDDTQAFRDALAAAERVFVPEPASSYLITGMIDVDGKVLEGASPASVIRADLSGSADSVALNLGLDATLRNVSVHSTRSTWDMSDPWSGVRVVHHNVTVRDVDLNGWEYGLHLFADGNEVEANNGVAYGDFRPRTITDCVDAIRLEGINNGWPNENTFGAARIAILSSRHTERDNLGRDCRGVYFVTDGYLPNSNKFIGTCVEYMDVGFEVVGQYNTFIGLRTENITSDHGVKFYEADNGNQARHNWVLGNYGNAGLGSSGQVVFEEADGNIPSHLWGNVVLARNMPLKTGTVNLHGSGYRRANVEYDSDSREFVFSETGGVVARLDAVTGDLRIAGTVTENASL